MTTVENTSNLNPRRRGFGGCAGVNPRSLRGRWLTWKHENDKQSYQGHKRDSDPAVRQIRHGGSPTPGVGVTGGGALAGPTAASGIDCLFYHMESTFGVHTSGLGLGGPNEHTDGNYVSGWRGYVNHTVDPIAPATSATSDYAQYFFSSIAGTEVSATSPRYTASAYTFTTASGYTVYKPAISWPLRSDASCGLEHIAFPQVSATRGFEASNGWCAVFVYQPSADPRSLYTTGAENKLRHVFWGNITSGTNRYFMFNHSVFEGSGYNNTAEPAVFHGVEEEVNLTSTHTLVTSSVGRGYAASDYTYSLYGSFGPVIQDWDSSTLPVRVDSSSHPNIVMFNVSGPSMTYDSGASAFLSSVAPFECIKVITSSNTGSPVYQKWTYRRVPGIPDSPNEDLSGYSGPATNPFFGAQDAAFLSLGWSPSNNGTTFTPLGGEGTAGIRHVLSGIHLYEVWIFCSHLDANQIYNFLLTVCGKYGLI